MTSAQITPAGLILSGALDIRHRLCRLLAGLEEAQVSADLGTRAVLGALTTDCRAELRKHVDAIRGQIVPARAAARSPDPAKWSSLQLDEIVRRAVVGFTGLAARHQEVYPQLDGSRRVREDLRYLLYRALNLSLVSPRHEGLVSLKTSGALQWETTSFRTAQGRTAAVAVPWLESLSPLRWPLVVHEVAHYFFPFGGEATEHVGDVSQAHGWSTDAFEEILADAIAQRHFGPAYAFALAREGYLYSYRKHVTGGLSVEQRLKVLGEPQDLLNALPAQWGLSQRETLVGNTVAIDDAVVAEMRAAVEDTLDVLAAAHDWTCEPNRPDIVAAAQVLMSQPEPAPAVPKADSADRIAAAIRDKQGDPDADIGSVVDAAVHTPLTDGEIFEAAWREEVTRNAEGIVEHLAAPLDDDGIDEEVATTVSRDIWLARSLQSAAVHRWLVRAMDYART
jgi:hypothetical protein